jgi:cell division protein FtsB
VRGLLLIPALVGVAIVCAAVDQGSGIRKSLQLRADLRASRARIESLRTQVEELRREAAALEGDPFAVERAIREDLGFARRGETVLLLPPAVGASHRFP